MVPFSFAPHINKLVSNYPMVFLNDFHSFSYSDIHRGLAYFCVLWTSTRPATAKGRKAEMPSHLCHHLTSRCGICRISMIWCNIAREIYQLVPSVGSITTALQRLNQHGSPPQGADIIVTGYALIFVLPLYLLMLGICGGPAGSAILHDRLFGVAFHNSRVCRCWTTGLKED